MLAHGICLYSTLVDTTSVFSKMVIPVSTLTGHERGFHLLPLVSLPLVLSVFAILDILMSVICVSVKANEIEHILLYWHFYFLFCEGHVEDSKQ